MKQILKGNNFTAVFVLICIIAFGIIGQGCQQEYESIDNDLEVMTSSELEDYIIAASDLYQSLRILENEFSKLDLSNLETVIENGRKITYLPASIRSLNIEKKTLLLNQKKDHLLNKYPQVSLQDLNNFTNIANHCIEQSTRINDFLLDKNINFYQPRTRSVIENYSFDTQNALVGYLYNWLLSPDYVEAMIVFFTDGTHLVVLDDRNTPYFATLSVTKTNNNYYYEGKQISKIAHTQMSGYNPSPTDIATKISTPGLEYSIFYNGAFHSY